MQIVIVGCGILGITSAWFLREAGHDVRVLDRSSGPGRETSFANGGLLHPSYVAPWNEPGIHRHLLRWVGREDAPMLLRVRSLHEYLGWGARFLAASRESTFRESARRNLALARFSKEVLVALRDRLALQYEQYARGSLMIFRDDVALNSAVDRIRQLSSNGVAHRLLDREEVVSLEPALAEIAEKLVGGIHFPDDEGGDAHRYCVEMARRFESSGGRLEFGVEINALVPSGSELKGLMTTDHAVIQADMYVLACASETTRLLSSVGIHLPVRPVKGYSVTLPREPGDCAPDIPVIDGDLHAAVVPIGDSRIRLAGTAEFAGDDVTIHPKRVDNLMRLLKRIFPAYDRRVDRAKMWAWAGLRPMTPDGVPVVSGTRFKNLFVNCGHGQIGWTTGPGSARLLADVLLGQASDLSPVCYDIDRF